MKRKSDITIECQQPEQASHSHFLVRYHSSLLETAEHGATALERPRFCVWRPGFGRCDFARCQGWFIQPIFLFYFSLCGLFSAPVHSGDPNAISYPSRTSSNISHFIVNE